MGVKGITKDHANDELLKHIGGRIEDTIAFGDAKMDIPMFEYCAVGVAMGNGGEEIKAVADFVTDTVAEDIETELVQVGIKAVRGCIGCRKCFETLARNMTFLMKSIALGKEKFGLPEKEEWVPTNFIR